MKKNKFLTSVLALTLVFSLGACTSETVDEGNENIESSNTSNEESKSINPAEILDLVNKEGNYTLTLSLNEYVSTETCSFSDWWYGSYDLEKMVSSLSYNGSYYDFTINYTEDALLIDCSLEGVSLIKMLYVNCYAYDSTGALVEAVAEFDWDIYQGDWSYYTTYQNLWQYYFYSLFRASSYGLTDETLYLLTDTGLDSNGNVIEKYTVLSSYTVFYLADLLGAYDFVFGYPAEYVAEIVWFDGITTYPELNEFSFVAGLGAFTYAYYYLEDYDQTSSDMVLVREGMDAYVSNIGTTTIDSNLIDYCLGLVS